MISDAINLKIPKRIPIVGTFGFFSAKYQGITIKEAMYDYEKMMSASVKTIFEFQPDAYDNPFGIRFLGQILETLNFKQLRWAGHGVGPTSSYQFVEDEYMRSDEYDDFLFDPSDFIIRAYWPRVFGAFNAFKELPPLNQVLTYYMGLLNFAAFDSSEIIKALEALLKAAKDAKRIINGAIDFAEKMKKLGIPPQVGSMTQAPFDTLGDFFRGTRGIMLDMYRNPDKLLEAMEKLLPLMVKTAISGSRKSGNKRVAIPLHKGSDTFMSIKQFKIFYWPTLRRLMLGLIDEGLIPYVFFEGDYTSRLEIIGDIPKGKVCYGFESTDIFKAKEIFGDQICIKGNVPLSILHFGNRDDVKNYCKKLIDHVGKNGGFIMDASGSLDDAKAENVKEMIEFTKEYGVYK